MSERQRTRIMKGIQACAAKAAQQHAMGAEAAVVAARLVAEAPASALLDLPVPTGMHGLSVILCTLDPKEWSRLSAAYSGPREVVVFGASATSNPATRQEEMRGIQRNPTL